MSVINSLPAMPNRIAIACEYFFTLGTDGGIKDEVLKQLSPLSKGDQDVVDEVSGGAATIASAVISEMENLELVIFNTKGGLSLAPSLLDEKGEDLDWQTLLRPILRERLTDQKQLAQFKQEGVGDALAWLLAQDPFRPIAKAGRHADLLREQLHEGDPLLTTIGNDSRFQNLLYWARYIGFAEWISPGDIDLAIPDPTRALDEFMPVIFDARPSLTIGEFSSRLAMKCGIFEGGAIRLELEQRSKSPAREQRHFARSTSLALARLENRGVISFRKEADAETWILDLSKEQRPVTSIQYLSKVRK